jgi:K+-sensing histidine kinase KdpD
LPDNGRQAINRHLHFAEGLHIRTQLIQGKNRARALVDYAHENGATQIFLCESTGSPKRWLSGLDFTDHVVQQARDLEVTVIAERSRAGRAPSAYPEDEAGSLMHSGYVAVSSEMTVEGAIAEIRRQAAQVEMIFYVYALNGSQLLMGVASFRELLSAERYKTVGEVMRTEYVAVQ